MGCRWSEVQILSPRVTRPWIALLLILIKATKCECVDNVLAHSILGHFDYLMFYTSYD